MCFKPKQVIAYYKGVELSLNPSYYKSLPYHYGKVGYKPGDAGIGNCKTPDEVIEEIENFFKMKKFKRLLNWKASAFGLGTILIFILYSIREKRRQ